MILIPVLFVVFAVLALIPFVGWFVIGLIWIAIIALAIAIIAFPVLGGIKANNGEVYRYPFTLRLIK